MAISAACEKSLWWRGHAASQELMRSGIIEITGAWGISHSAHPIHTANPQWFRYAVAGHTSAGIGSLEKDSLS